MKTKMTLGIVENFGHDVFGNFSKNYYKHNENGNILF